MSAAWFQPDWPRVPRVRAAMSLRAGGVSAGPFESLNLGAHVGDDPLSVAANRARLCESVGLPAEPRWLQQVHGSQVHRAAGEAASTVPPMADACVCAEPGVVLAVMVADCLPVLLAARDGSAIAVAHAGWRGLAAGVLEAALQAMCVPPSGVQAWLGPAISQPHFEVGAEVREAFESRDARAGVCFESNPRGRWQCDLPGLARHRLLGLGVASVSDCGLCTWRLEAECFSYRRDGRTGRMAALLWLDP